MTRPESLEGVFVNLTYFEGAIYNQSLKGATDRRHLLVTKRLPGNPLNCRLRLEPDGIYSIRSAERRYPQGIPLARPAEVSALALKVSSSSLTKF